MAVFQNINQNQLYILPILLQSNQALLKLLYQQVYMFHHIL
nr:MAG TPA: hypothetical protein [Caudoviricetes sp.]